MKQEKGYLTQYACSVYFLCDQSAVSFYVNPSDETSQEFEAVFWIKTFLIFLC